MVARDLLYEGQAEAGAPLARGEEGREDLGADLVGHAGAAVAYLPYNARSALAPRREHDLSRRPRSGDGVLGQVEQGAAELGAVGARGKTRRAFHA